MSKTTNKFCPEVRERAVRMVFDNETLNAVAAVAPDLLAQNRVAHIQNAIPDEVLAREVELWEAAIGFRILHDSVRKFLDAGNHDSHGMLALKQGLHRLDRALGIPAGALLDQLMRLANDQKNSTAFAKPMAPDAFGLVEIRTGPLAGRSVFFECQRTLSDGFRDHSQIVAMSDQNATRTSRPSIRTSDSISWISCETCPKCRKPTLIKGSATRPCHGLLRNPPVTIG